jgi:hypothetical protein
VQVLRTYPAKRVPFPFAPRGERSIARAYAKALGRARSLLYVEDQYLWSPEVGRVIAQAHTRTPEMRMIALVTRHPDGDGAVSGPLNRLGQQETFGSCARRAECASSDPADPARRVLGCDR